MASTPKRILAIRFSAMGDVAITVPAIASMLKQHPNVKLYMLSNAAFAPFFEQLEGVTFIGVNLKNYKGIKGLYKLYKELRVHNFDLIADLHNVIRSKIIRTFFRFSGKKVVSIDKGRKGKKALTRKKNKKLVQLETSAERYADVFRKAGFPIKLDFTSIYADNTTTLSTNVQQLIENVDAPKIGIAPFAKHTGKIYPVAQMEEVIKQLNEKGYKIYLFGGGGEEKQILETWEKQYPNCTSMVGKLKLAEELQLISRLNVMLSMDSGNMHLASLVNTPVVSVWGATHPFAGFYGWGQQPADIVQIDLFCRPCSVYGNKPCYRNNYECLTRISPEMIIEKLSKYL